MKLLVFIFIASFFTPAVVQAQVEPVIPAKYKFDSAEDYRQYEKIVLNSIDWLQNTPRNTESVKRKAVEEFVVKWIYGTPYVSVVIEPYAMDLSKKNADLLLTFIFGYTTYKLKNLTDKDALTANLAGIEQMIEDYKSNIAVLKVDASLERLIELQKAGTLADWIKPKLTAGNKVPSEN